MNTLNIKPVTAPFVISADENVKTALESLHLTGGIPLIVLGSKNILEGTLSNGDISRFLRGSESVDLNTKVIEVCNTSPIIGHDVDPLETLQQYLNRPSIKVLPIVDTQRQVKKIAFWGAPALTIGDRLISDNHNPFMLAEIGVNHQGDMAIAKHLIDAAHQAGCDGVKFQHRSTALYSTDSIDKYDLGTQYILSEIKRTNLSAEELKELCQYSASLGLKVVVTPFDTQALLEAQEMSIDALKIASCDLTNYELIEACTETGYPMILSTGMSYERQILKTAAILEQKLVDHAFLHCNSTYPAPVEDANLAYISRLKGLVKCPVGYSSHDIDTCIPLASIAAGAAIVEFHITRSRDDIGTDHRASIELKELPGLIKSARMIAEAIGSDNPRTPSQGELANKLSLGKSWGAAHSMKEGEIIKRKDLRLISPGSGFTSDQLDRLLDRPLLKPINKGELVEIDHIEAANENTNDLIDAVSRLNELGYISGIPVRYHDYSDLAKVFNTPMYEFHMSDRDLTISPDKYLTEKSDAQLIIHAVEQFEDGFIFDLCSDKQDIVERSFKEVERLANTASALMEYFPNTEVVPVVLNLGGFTENGFLNPEQASEKCRIGVGNLKKVAELHPHCKFMPQTMPPFPWHQGGKSYHNLLTSKQRIAEFLELFKSEICFDVSHTALSCEYFGEDLYELAEIVGPQTHHIHLSDAKGSNAEGLAIGDGSINMARLHYAMTKHQAQPVFMIPEIWQGHLRKGEGFAISLIRYADILKQV
ncbi:MAG: N-acetylneuraminate synthase family protein [Porticoccaceae bacterium]